MEQKSFVERATRIYIIWQRHRDYSKNHRCCLATVSMKLHSRFPGQNIECYWIIASFSSRSNWFRLKQDTARHNNLAWRPPAYWRCRTGESAFLSVKRRESSHETPKRRKLRWEKEREWRATHVDIRLFVDWHTDVVLGLRLFFFFTLKESVIFRLAVELKGKMSAESLSTLSCFWVALKWWWKRKRGFSFTFSTPNPHYKK